MRSRLESVISLRSMFCRLFPHAIVMLFLLVFEQCKVCVYIYRLQIGHPNIVSLTVAITSRKNTVSL